ncbi:MAG: transketolase C-terminal domain-containing protein [Myxococcota bacterium]
MNVLQHLAEVVAGLLREDNRRIVLGEDVIDGGMLGLTRAVAADAELRERLIATPLTPSVTFAHAAGLALGGRRPLVVLASTTALLEGLAGLREACVMEWRTAQARRVPMLIVAPCGPGFSIGGDASDGIEGVLSRVRGIRVLCAGQAGDAGAWLRAAAELADAEGPTVLLLPRTLLLRELNDPPRHDLGRGPIEAHAVRDGNSATVFAWGESVELALAATERAGVDAAVIDVGCLCPLDRDGLAAHARATGKLVIAHGSDRAVAGELAALFADEAILHLDAPVTSVGGAAGPVSAGGEAAALPSVDRLAQAIVSVAEY